MKQKSRYKESGLVMTDQSMVLVPDSLIQYDKDLLEYTIGNIKTSVIFWVPHGCRNGSGPNQHFTFRIHYFVKWTNEWVGGKLGKLQRTRRRLLRKVKSILKIQRVGN